MLISKIQAFIRQQEGNLSEWMQFTSKFSDRRWKNKYCVLPVLPQSIILSMQEGVMSSYVIKSNSEVGSRPRVGEWLKQFS